MSKPLIHLRPHAMTSYGHCGASVSASKLTTSVSGTTCTVCLRQAIEQAKDRIGDAETRLGEIGNGRP